MGSVDITLSKMAERPMERKHTLLNQIEREKKRKNGQRYCTLEVTSCHCDSDSSTDENVSYLYSIRKRPKNIWIVVWQGLLIELRLAIVVQHILLQQPRRA